MKKTCLPKNNLRSIRLMLALLLAGWLGLSQLTVAAHDAIHHLHAHVDLCDALSGHGNGPALTATAGTQSLPPAVFHPGCSHTAEPVRSLPYPAFHSRAPPR